MILVFKIATICILCISTLEAKTFRKQRGPPPPDTPKRTATVLPKWNEITQRVDHFNPADLRTWTMRYLSSDQFFNETGPIFVYLGGEWDISPGTLMSGQIFEMAEEHQGYMFYTEHRYYGKSFPTEDISSENLRYLSVDQALADVVYFIDHVKNNILGLEDSKVVVIGCSYSASMATWLRSKYPHAVDAAYASSGPVRAVIDFYEYLEVVGKAINSTSKDCLEIIRNGTAELEAKLETEEGIEEMTERLNMCSKIKNEEPHRCHFFSTVVVDVFSGLTQYATPTTLKDSCDRLSTYEGAPLDKLIAFTKEYYGMDDEECLDTYDEAIEEYKSDNITDDASRAWFYQTCTEFGYYQTTNSDNQPFSQTNPLDYYFNLCVDLYGEEFGSDILGAAIKRTNMFYGSVHPEVTKLVSVHGTVDPWHALGILEDLNPLAPAILIKGTSHCADLNGFNYDDSDELKAAKTRVKKLIAEWIQE